MKPTQRPLRVLAAMLLVGATGQTVSADWHEFWHGVRVGFHRNNAWPDPFNEADAMQVVRPFEIMKRNGWRVHNTIGHELFREGDGALLAAGHNRVQWIATQSPAARRQVFVLRGRTDAETRARVTSVERALAHVGTSGPEAQVLVTEAEPGTAPGPWATKVNRAALEQMPMPRLPSKSSSGQAGVTTSSGGSGR